MATNDTDPQRTQPFADDASRTEPGAPPAADDANADAAALLAGLAESSQPVQDVPETQGHVAAAYAAAPRRPPRPNDKTVENPAVFINATVPLPDPPSSSRQKLGPPAAPFVSMNGAPTVPGGARLFEELQRNETTEPGERAKNQMRVYLACIAGVMVAGLIAVGILVFLQRRSPTVAPSTTDPSSSSASSTASPTSVAAPILTPEPVVTVAPTSTASSTSPSPAPSVSTKPPLNVRPHGSSPSPRPSATFAEPDRHL